jgi:hypothetical protein
MDRRRKIPQSSGSCALLSRRREEVEPKRIPPSGGYLEFLGTVIIRLVLSLLLFLFLVLHLPSDYCGIEERVMRLQLRWILHVSMTCTTLVATRVGHHLRLTMGSGKHEFLDKLMAVATKEAGGVLFYTS